MEKASKSDKTFKGKYFTSSEGGVDILFGHGRAFNAAEVQRALTNRGASRVVVVTSAGGHKRNKNLIDNSFGDLVVGVWDKAEPHVPQTTVDQLKEFLTAAKADAVVAVGGGSTVGVCKGVALTEALLVAAIPTTFSGSEMTNIYGISSDEEKVTGRNDRVRPSIVIYDSSLLSHKLGSNSLFNALAHCVEALWAAPETTSPLVTLAAQEGVKAIVKALKALDFDKQAEDDQSEAIDLALYGAFMAGKSLAASMGVHHKVAHVLGGSFGLPHDAAHTALLPHSVHFNAPDAVEAMNVIAEALGATEDEARQDPSGVIFQLIRSAGGQLNLRSLGFTPAAAADAAAQVMAKWGTGVYKNPRNLDLPSVHRMLSNALHGRRPGFPFRPEGPEAGWPHDAESKGHANASVLPLATAGCSIEDAAVVIVGVHGRFASAEQIIEQAQETLLGGLTNAQKRRVALVAPQASASTWYPKSAFVDTAENQPALDEALGRVQSVLSTLHKRGVPPARIVVFGFSQGACLALESVVCLSATSPCPVAAVVAIAGALIGPGDEPQTDYTAGRVATKPSLAGVRFLLGVADQDPHVPIVRTRATAALLQRLGASAIGEEYFEGATMTNHRITPEQKASAVALFQDVFVASLTGPLAAKSSGIPVSQPQLLLANTSTCAGQAPAAYLAGFFSPLQSSALPGALPVGFNQPARSPYGLYNEQINGTAFVAPRAVNYRSWLYRLRPSVASMQPFEPVEESEAPLFVGDFSLAGGKCSMTPEPLRFNGIPVPPASETKLTFVSGLATLGGSGSPVARAGWAIHWYRINTSMEDESFYNSDGDMLFMPEQGILLLTTEFGRFELSMGEFFVLPQGLKVSVALKEGSGSARGWVSEIFQGHFKLPDRGPVGSNHFAEPRDFLAPVASFEDKQGPHRVISKFGGQLFASQMDHSPFNAVAWHGNYYPVKYALENFNPITSALRDHPDPSSHTVLSVPLDDANSLLDFVVFKGRYDVGEESFRPPYYHRNRATEFNGIVSIDEVYSGFDAGVCFLTPMMTPHGISAASTQGFNEAVAKNIPATDEPKRLSDDSIWFMFESCSQMSVTKWAQRDTNFRDVKYREFWGGLEKLNSNGKLPNGHIIGGPPGFH